FTLLLCSLKLGSKRAKLWRGLPTVSPGRKIQRPHRIRLQLEMLEDRRVLSNVLPLFDPFGPGLLSDAFHASDLADTSPNSTVLAGNPTASPASSSGRSASANVGASSNSGASAVSQPPPISAANSAVLNSPFLGAIANHSSSASHSGTA